MNEKKLKEYWDYAVNLGYNEDRFLGIFYCKNNNESKIVNLPSFTQMCLNENWILQEIKYNNQYIKIIDIRMLQENKSKIYDDCFILNPKYKELFYNYFINEKKCICNEGIVEILKYSFMEDKLGNISKKEFFKQLTNAEIKAYYSIIKEIGEEGNITISKLVEKNTISRSVYNNLIAKMKENKIAFILNMGMKGTYIKITEPELRAEAFNI